MPTNTTQEQRVRQELSEVGVTSFGMLKFASRHLARVLYEDEHVRGAVYGRYASGSGWLTWTEGMLVATDRRILFIDRKPGYEALDELSYDIVSGVQKSYAWPFSAITLHTRIGDYSIRFANQKCIDAFIHYVGVRRLESKNHQGKTLLGMDV